MADRKLVFLFGAGASFAAGLYTKPKPTPLMPCLFDRLAHMYPKEWGETSTRWAHRAAFRKNFEDAYTEHVLGSPTDTDRPVRNVFVLEALGQQWPLSHFFGQFILDGSGADPYSLLLQELVRRGQLAATTFASLNYDCLLEQAINAAGQSYRYLGVRDQPPDGVAILKLHASSNWITKYANEQWARDLMPSATHLDLGIEVLSVLSLSDALQAAQQSGQYPVIGHISGTKAVPPAAAAVQRIRTIWRQLKNDDIDLVVVGVTHNVADWHINEVVETASHVRYIGNTAQCRIWRQQVNAKTEHLGEKFEDSLSDLLAAL